MVDIRILGSFEVRAGGRILELGGPRPRTLLAVLAVHIGEVVSADRLVDELWGDAPPRSAQHLLHVYVSSLRKAVGAALVTRSPGYVLDAGIVEVDAIRFEHEVGEGRRLLAGGDAEGASVVLREAIGLWRGPALLDFTYEPFAQGAIARLEELRMLAQEERVEAGLALGRHAELVADLEALIDEYPLRERLRGQLMLALYRSGRQSEALAAYLEARRVLVEEVGVEPGPALGRLEQAILRQDSELELEPADDLPAPPAHATRKLVTIVVAGLAGDGLDGLDPEARRRVVVAGLETVSAVLERHGAAVERSLGEEVVGVFGIPIANEDDALRAVRAGLDARDAISTANTEIEGSRSVRVEAHVGIEAGEVIADGQAVVGGALRRAVGLSRSAGPGEVLAGEDAYRLTRHAVLADPSSTDRPYGARRLLAVLPDALALPRRLGSALVGRRRELDQLAATVERTFGERKPVVVTLIGEAGVGKSRLAGELISEIAGATTVLVGRCESRGEGLTFGPVREVVRQALDDESDTALLRLLGDDEDREAVAAAVATAIGATRATVRREESFRAFSRFFAAVARKRPLLLVFEDVHWGEGMFLDLVEHIAGRMGRAPVVVLCLARPELLERRPGWATRNPEAARILLQPLSDDESATLLENLSSEVALPARVRTRVVAAAEGNPLFLEQMAAMLAEQPHSSDETSLPATIRAVLVARLDRLGPGERAVVERASVVGRDFTLHGLLQLLPDEAGPSARRHLHSLMRKRLVEPRSSPHDKDSFRFQHALIQDAAYRAVTKELRAELHQRFARWLEQGSESGLSDLHEVVGYHLERAHQYIRDVGPPDEPSRTLAARASRHLESAGYEALDRGDVGAAVGLLERALALAHDEGADGVEIMYRLADAHERVGGRKRGVELRTAAMDAARAAGDRRLELRVRVAQAEARFYRDGDPEPAEELLAHVVPELVELGDDLALARARCVIGLTAMAAGRHGDALAVLERALEHARRIDDPLTVDDAAVGIVNVLSDGPTPIPTALERADLFIGDVLGRVGMASIKASRGLMLATQDRLGEARTLHARAREELEEMGIRPITVLTCAGEAELIAGDAELAERALGEAWDLVAAGDQAIPWISERRARALRELGRLDDAQRFIDIAERHLSPAVGELNARTRATRALIRLDRGEREGAVDDALEAERLSEPLDTPPFESPRYRGEILLAAARILQSVGRREDALRRAVAAAGQFEKKADLVSAGRARELAAALRVGSESEPDAVR